MNQLVNRLALLEPQIKHFLEWSRDGVVITLMDPVVRARVSRLVSRRYMEDVQYIESLVAQTVNELGKKRSLRSLDVEDAPATRNDE